MHQPCPLPYNCPCPFFPRARAARSSVALACWAFALHARHRRVCCHRACACPLSRLLVRVHVRSPAGSACWAFALCAHSRHASRRPPRRAARLSSHLHAVPCVLAAAVTVPRACRLLAQRPSSLRVVMPAHVVRWSAAFARGTFVPHSRRCHVLTYCRARDDEAKGLLTYPHP